MYGATIESFVLLVQESECLRPKSVTGGSTMKNVLEQRLGIAIRAIRKSYLYPS